MNKRGFTMVEIVVTLLVLSVLLTVGIYTTLGSQSTYRDRERGADIDSIKIALEDYYKDHQGTYPTASLVVSSLQSKVDEAIMIAPGQNSISLQAGQGTDASAGSYIYQVSPANCDNIATECRSYQLHYRKEADGSLQTVLSKN